MRMNRLGIAAGCIAAVVALTASLFIPLDQTLFSRSRTTSLRIADRNGVLLREVLSEQEGRGAWRELKDVAPHVLQAVIAAEDARYYAHPGVDPLAVVRAAWQNVKSRRIVSGGSTITMQVVRSVYPIPRTFLGKLREAWYALRLERMMTKHEILEQYINRVAFGYQTIGVDAATRLYFNKPASQLSLAEAAFLAAIPNSPANNDPYRRFDRVQARQRHVLRRMEQEEFISHDERERAEQEPLVLSPRTARFKAPHFTTMILQNLTAEERTGLEEIRTTLDYSLQQTAERLVQAHLARLQKHDVTNAALVVVDNASHEVLALVGSRDFFDTTIQGQVNGALALRQPGSTLKPFTYGMALEHGMTAAELLADIPRTPGQTEVDFLPENYDRKYHGPVRLRTALACSYNVPAVRTLELFGEELLLRTLHAAGFASLNKPASHYGLGLTLGNGDVSLMELAGSYSALANGGMYVVPKLVRSARKTGEAHIGGEANDMLRRHLADSTRVFSPQVAYLITDILSDAQARAPAFGVHSSLTMPFPCAAKTGTSKDYRDNWTVGYTPRYTVAVWVGNFNGRPMKLVSGITGAAPLFRDMMVFLHQSDRAPLAFVCPPGLTTRRICPRSGMPPSTLCPGEVTELFIAGTEPEHVCTVHRKFRLDARNGLLATRTTPQASVIERVFEIFPPEYNRWLEKEGIPQPPTSMSGHRAAKQSLGSQSVITIQSPTNGEIFKLDPILRPQYQTITIEPIVSPGVDGVLLYVNGKEIASLAPPYRYRLPLASLHKGSLTLVVKGKKEGRVIESEPVRIAVQ